MGTKATDATEKSDPQCQWEDVSWAGDNKQLQLVIPREVAPTILSDLYNSPSGVHLGTAKLLHVCLRFYWVRQRYDVEKWCQDILGPLQTRTTLYHPQSERKIERFNRTLLSLLGMAASEVDWDKLSMIILAYRTSVHENTKSTPFSMMYGREVRLPIISIMFEHTPSVHQYARKLASNLGKAYNKCL